MTKKKNKFGSFYSLSPNAGNVEYNNKVFNSMMMPGGGETSQGDSQSVAEDLNKDDTTVIRRKIRYNELPGRDYFDKVKRLAQDIINYLKKNPESTYDFVLINDEGFKASPEEFHNDLVDFLQAEDYGRYSITQTLRSYKDTPTMFDYNYSVYDDLARYGELREAQEKALPVGEATFISKPQRYRDLDTFKAKLIMNPMTLPEKYRAKVSVAADIKSFDDLDRVVEETHFVGGHNIEDNVINALEILSSDGIYLVNPEGYDYARYVAFIPKEIEEDMKENLEEAVEDYKITSMEDILDGMPDNADDETIDTTLKVFRKVSSNLGTHKKDIVVLVTDPYTEYDPKNSDIEFEVEEIPHRFKQSSLHTYKTPDYEFIRERVYPANMVFLYFKNEGDKDQYLNDVYGAGDIQEDVLEELEEGIFDAIRYRKDPEYQQKRKELATAKLDQKINAVNAETEKEKTKQSRQQARQARQQARQERRLARRERAATARERQRIKRLKLQAKEMRLEDKLGMSDEDILTLLGVPADKHSESSNMVTQYKVLLRKYPKAEIIQKADQLGTEDILGSTIDLLAVRDGGRVMEESLKESADGTYYWGAYYWDAKGDKHKILFPWDTPDWGDAEDELDAIISEPYSHARLLGRMPKEAALEDGFELIESLKEAVEEDKPFTYREVYDELKREGDLNNSSGQIHYGFESEAKAAHKILSRKHKNCEMKELPSGHWEVVWDDEKLEESLTESVLVDKADTYSQRELIRIIEEIAKDLRIKLHYGNKVGKVPQTIILDYKPQDNAISINPDGSLEIGEIELGNKAKKQDIAQALRSLLELNEKLIQSDSDKALQKNIKTEIEAGKDPKQAAAIAYSVQEKNKKKEESYIENTWNDVLVEEVDDNPAENYLDF